MSDFGNFNAPGNAAWIRYDREPPSHMERRQFQPYQFNLERVAVGRDHWAQYTGRRGATRQDFYEKKIAADGIGRVPPWSKPLSEIKDHAPALKPWIQHNRWVATCECGGQEVVDPDDPGFFCWSCGNATNKGFPRRVEFDDRAFDAAQVLIQRDPRHRIWDRHGHLLGREEAVADLIRESEDHGDRVDPALKQKYRRGRR